KRWHPFDLGTVEEPFLLHCPQVGPSVQSLHCSQLFYSSWRLLPQLTPLYEGENRPWPDAFLLRIGPKEDFFHCSKCNLCLSLSLRGKHKCIENVSRQDCPICLEDIHTSRVGAHVLPCGHLLHRGYRCPLCMHSALDMTRYWRQMDDEVALTPMPTEYQNVTVKILCNDCNARSTVQFHLLGMKCKNCESYNTTQEGRCQLPLEEQ
uniref:Ring finger and CHY zinc finger domain containing 1 n=1 Tax=Calidris pygmaea TaxID=425635 RepID=A0A8C3J7R8_9CHAR